MSVIAQPGRLTLTGYVGESSVAYEGTTWFDGFTHGEVLAALGEFHDGEAIVVHINSGGGYATEGAAIRSALAERAGRTDVFVEGIAASAASLIAMAGETITMATDAVLMVHDPAGLTMGTAADHEATVRALNSIAGAYARTYAAKSGKTVADCREIMRAETWFNADEAVAAGFADAVEGEAEPVAAFPYQTYAHAPQRLVALARDNGWRAPAVRAAAANPAASSAARKTDIESACRAEAAVGAVKADRARRQSIMALDEAKGREALAEHLYANTEMTVEEIKATPLIEDYEQSRILGAGLGGPMRRPTAAEGWKAIADGTDTRRKTSVR
jgi:ATP-dependent protease ClpP protease subunit